MLFGSHTTRDSTCCLKAGAFSLAFGAGLNLGQSGGALRFKCS